MLTLDPPKTALVRPKPSRKPLQPIKPAPTNIPFSQNPKQTLECVENANKENPNNGIVQKVQVLEQFEVSLADELNVMREKINRLRADKEKTEKMLKERGIMMEMKMKELEQRGEVQKELEIEVDRLYRLNELKTLCNRILPIRSLRDKEQEKIKPDRSQ
ncbi:hypothetical protein Tco_1035626, partial [Tanacetum coccineum]